jgi:hypothetical protein
MVAFSKSFSKCTSCTVLYSCVALGWAGLRSAAQRSAAQCSARARACACECAPECPPSVRSCASTRGHSREQDRTAIDRARLRRTRPEARRAGGWKRIDGARSAWLGTPTAPSECTRLSAERAAVHVSERSDGPAPQRPKPRARTRAHTSTSTSTNTRARSRAGTHARAHTSISTNTRARAPTMRTEVGGIGCGMPGPRRPSHSERGWVQRTRPVPPHYKRNPSK